MNTHRIRNYIGMALALIAGGGAGAAIVEDMPLVELAPYMVETAGGPWLAARTEIAESGRLLLEDPAQSGRASSWLSLQDLQHGAAAAVEDVFWRVAGAGSPARFGVVTVPNLRGDAAESLLNGQRRGDNLFGLPSTWTMVESVEVVKGPPLLQTGPGKRSGGLFNLTTKRPVEGVRFGSVDLRLGTWIPGEDGYLTMEAVIDQNLPLGKGQALRLAAGIRDDATYYAENGGRDDCRDLYLAWQRKGGDGSTLDWMAYFLDADRPQTLGVNRPWQGLIDNGLYLTGGVDPGIGQSDPPGFLDPGIADPGLIVSGPGALAPLPADHVLLSRGDVGRGTGMLSQARWRKPLAGGLEFEQAIMAERVRREKYHGFLYSERVRQLTIDSLTRLRGDLTNRLGRLDWDTGLNLRLEQRDNRSNYWNEFAYAYDITAGRRFSAMESYPDNIAPGAVTDAGGQPWYLPSSLYGTPETTDSRLRQAGVFAGVAQQLGGGWALSGGVRIDTFALEAAEPADIAPADLWRDRRTPAAGSGSVTLSRESGKGRAYATLGTFGGNAGNTVGDGLNLYPPGSLHPDDYSNRSRLLEIGGGWRPFDGLDLSWAAFDQRRRRQEFFGSNDLKVRGVELESEWQATASSRLRLAGSFLDARYDNAAPAEFGGGSLWNAYAPGAGPDGQGNGIGYVRGFFVNSPPPGDYRLPGLSRWMISCALEQRLTEHLSLLVWGTWQSRQDGNLAGEYRIPSQSEWNASLLYATRDWEVQLIARNLLDATNWIHNGDTFFDQMLVSRNLPLRLEARLRLRF